jgi:hypothetical protein
MTPARICAAFSTALIAIATAGIALAQALNVDALLDMLRHDHYSASWDPASPVAGDFDGDGQWDLAAVGVEGGNIVVAVANQPVGSPTFVQYLDFSVGKSPEEGVCSLQAQLEAVPLACGSGDQLLPGCRDKPGAAALRLADAPCGAIIMYWNHDSGRMVSQRVRDLTKTGED